MIFHRDQLEVKQSTLPNAGQGLFTNLFIKKGSLVVEYTGTVTTWNAVKGDATNGYIYFVNSNHVIDASQHPAAPGRYANDAQGQQRIKGIRNNARYLRLGDRVYIQAIIDIPAGMEILVSYGKAYWETIRNNKRLKANKRK